MPRQARSPGSSGFFHVIIRGNAKQLIFEEDDDRRFFLNRMMKYSAETGVAICAYCLMENHVHLLLRDNSNALAQFMKKLNGSYARFFNWKYERTGHLFKTGIKASPSKMTHISCRYSDTFFVIQRAPGYAALPHIRGAVISNITGINWSIPRLSGGCCPRGKNTKSLF